MPGRYTFCFGEDEEGSPWEPLHVERGFQKEVSTVTVAAVQATHNVGTVTPGWRSWLEMIGDSMATTGNNNMWFPKGGEPLVVLCSGHAAELTKAGLSKSDVKRGIFEHAWTPESKITPEMRARLPNHLIVDGKARPCERAEDIMIVVAGGPSPYHAVVMPTFGSQTKAVTRPIVSREKG